MPTPRQHLAGKPRTARSRPSGRSRRRGPCVAADAPGFDRWTLNARASSYPAARHWRSGQRTTIVCTPHMKRPSPIDATCAGQPTTRYGDAHIGDWGPLMVRDESWRQRRLHMRSPNKQPGEPRDDPPQWVVKRAAWNSPPADTAPVPLWRDECGQEYGQPRPGEPMDPVCSPECPWYMGRAIVRARARLSNRPVAPGQVAHCMVPGRQILDTDGQCSPCWPAVNAIWRRAFARPEAK